MENNGQSIALEIDGGINSSTITSAFSAGADTFVVGSAIFETSNYVKAINSLRESINLNKA
ncbi:MAG: hypothetical protein IR526_02605 [Bordetella sp.]|nr:MAG: hypothetical protein IR526_02605 [Bordetella sp.]